MLIVADASVLVAELVRVRGWALISHPELRIVTTEEQLSETQHELERRLHYFIERGRVAPAQVESIRLKIQRIFDDNAIDVVQGHVYRHLEPIAWRRVPRDPTDWPTVALAIALGAGILTEDHDFLGCGCATWTFETLRDELAHGDSPR